MINDLICLAVLTAFGFAMLLWAKPPRRKPTRVLYEYVYDARYDDRQRGFGCLVAAILLIALIVVVVLSSTASP